MALLTKPADFTAAVPSVTALNDAVNRLYTELGYTAASGGDDQGDLTDVNIAAAAAIQRTKIADTAVVCGNTVGAGTQTVTRPTAFTGGLTVTGESIDVTSANYTATTAIADGATTIAIADASKRFQLYSYPNTATADAAITTVTGATAGKIYTFIINNADAGSYCRFHHTDSNLANSFKMKQTDNTGFATISGSIKTALPTGVGTEQSYVSFGSFIFGDLGATGASQFWEL